MYTTRKLVKESICETVFMTEFSWFVTAWNLIAIHLWQRFHVDCDFKFLRTLNKGWELPSVLLKTWLFFLKACTVDSWKSVPWRLIRHLSIRSTKISQSNTEFVGVAAVFLFLTAAYYLMTSKVPRNKHSNPPTLRWVMGWVIFGFDRLVVKPEFFFNFGNFPCLW